MRAFSLMLSKNPRVSFLFLVQADDKKKRYMSASDLQVCVGEAKEKGWNAGIMFWQWSDVSVRKLGRSV